MKRYKPFNFKESKKYKYIAYSDVVNNRYKSIKPYREYLILTSNSEIENDGRMVCYKNVLRYTKKEFSNGKISNEMVLLPISNMCIDTGRKDWIFDEGLIEV